MRKKFILSGMALTLTSASLSGAEPNLLAEPPRLVPIEPISIPIVDGDRIDGKLNYTLVIMVEDDETMKRLSGSGAALRAAALRGGLDFARLYASSFTAVDAGMLMENLTRAMKEEDEGITELLLVEVSAFPS